MRTEVVLARLEEFERRVAGLYRRYAESFDDDPEARSFFARMASDEEGHAALARNQGRLPVSVRSGAPDVEADLDDIDAGIATVEEAGVRARSCTLAEALVVAFQLETSAAEYHYRGALALSGAGFGSLLQALADADTEHMQRLREFARLHPRRVPGKRISRQMN